MPQSEQRKREYMRSYMRLRRGSRGDYQGGEHRLLVPIERDVSPSVSPRDVFTDTVLPTREANERSTVTISTGNHVVNPRTGEILGMLDNTGRMEKLEAIVGILEERVASLSYAIAEMQAEAIGAETVEPTVTEWKEWASGGTDTRP